MANSEPTFVFKKLPDLSYRSHKLLSSAVGSVDFEIRPAFLERVTLSKTTSRDPGRCWSSSAGDSMSTVTGVPSLVELDDDAFNTLDPGQLLRESAAAASRMLADSAPRRRPPSTNQMVDELLEQIYRPPVSLSRNVSVDNDDNDEDDEDQLSSSFSTNCADSLGRKDIWELEVMREHLRSALSRVTSSLVQQLTRRDRLRLERERHCDVITAILQAASPKRSQDTKMRFSVDPPAMPVPMGASPVQGQRDDQQPGADSSGFQQWHDAMRMVARLPGGVPSEFRRKLWLTLAEQYLLRTGVDWQDVERNCFNDRINPDDEDLGAQIVRDLHRTGCSLFCGDDALPNQALLKRVLLAYARWNKAVGYCQGLNVLAALLLEVMNRSESESLKVMIYLIEGVLPEGYFANNLRGLSVDMAVFRDLLRQRLPALSRHLEMLQQQPEMGGGSCIEPPLTNVFTMQWFLTLFATCLPKAAVLRVWDLVFLEGNDVLLRTALAIWHTLAERILTVRTCDDFYSIMAVLAREMLEFGLMEPNHLVQTIVSMAPFPFPGLSELRDKYRYNITPWSDSSSQRVPLFYSDDDPEADEIDEDEEKTKALNAIATVFGGLMTSSGLFRQTGRRISDITAFRKHQQHQQQQASDKEKLQLDIAALRKQYAKLRERQKQAHVMFWTAASNSATAAAAATPSNSSATANNNPVMANLLAGKKALLLARRSSAASGPRLRLPPPARVVPPTSSTSANVITHAYFSAPTTPSGKESDAPPLFVQHQQQQKDGPHINQPLASRRNSGTDNKPGNHQHPTPSSKGSWTGNPVMSANRSRLVQELLEQNSAVLQKLKDRSETGSSGQHQPNGEAASDINKQIANQHQHSPFPMRQRSPNDVTVKLKMYEPAQKY